MERNLPDASIDIDVRSNTRGISIIFKDNGASVSEQEISSYLDNFYPGQSLNFAAMIAESHLGKLSVANRDDSQGIVIDFSLYIE
jgi:K+-sensing histidine kinase KdpD